MSVQCVSDVGQVQKLLDAHKHVVIDFMAEWCGPCKMLGPKIEKLAELYPSVCFMKVDVDRMDATFIQKQDVSAMPTIKFFRDGKGMDALTVVGANLTKIKTGLKTLTD